MDVTWSHRAQQWSLVVVLGFGVLYVVGLLTGFLERAIAVPLLVVFAACALWQVGINRRVPDQAPFLRVDAAGVTAAGRLLPWSDVAQVVVTRMRPWWAWFPGRGRMSVVAFVGREGVDLPAAELPGGQPRMPWADAVARRYYGTRLLVPAQFTTVRAEELVAAVRAVSDVAVVDRR